MINPTISVETYRKRKRLTNHIVRMDMSGYNDPTLM